MIQRPDFPSHERSGGRPYSINFKYLAAPSHIRARPAAIVFLVWFWSIFDLQ